MVETRAQIIATIGPASASSEVVERMAAAGLDVVRLNFAWSTVYERKEHVAMVRAAASAANKRIPIMQDLPGPRVQLGDGHSYDPAATALLTQEDERSIEFGAALGLEYVALSFVRNAADIETGRAAVSKYGGGQKIIAKIERAVALQAVDEIIAAADAIMIARGDLGNEMPLEEIPFTEAALIKKATAAGKPVIVATQMLLSMVEHAEPTRAEVTDVATAIMQGADAVMLSEETTTGKYPVEAVAMMERIVAAAERHLGPHAPHPL